MVYAMNKVPIAEQIEALEGCLSMGPSTFEPYIGLPGYMAINAALSTLKWVERHQAELRVLGEFPIAKIEVKDLVHADDPEPGSVEKVTQAD
jgi:hypothetical protein